MFDGEVSKRRTFAKATLQTRAEAEGLSAILRDDACEGLECHTEEVSPALVCVCVCLCVCFFWLVLLVLVMALVDVTVVAGVF